MFPEERDVFGFEANGFHRQTPQADDLDDSVRFRVHPHLYDSVYYVDKRSYRFVVFVGTIGVYDSVGWDYSDFLADILGFGGVSMSEEEYVWEIDHDNVNILCRHRVHDWIYRNHSTYTADTMRGCIRCKKVQCWHGNSKGWFMVFKTIAKYFWENEV